MASPSRDARPVLEERRGRPRSRVCGKEGCAMQLFSKHHKQARLCMEHIRCLTVLRGGVPRRWCIKCHKFQALKAFSGSQRHAPTSHYLALRALCLPTK